jgi:hypothetical protein
MREIGERVDVERNYVEALGWHPGLEKAAMYAGAIDPNLVYLLGYRLDPLRREKIIFQG